MFWDPFLLSAGLSLEVGKRPTNGSLLYTCTALYGEESEGLYVSLGTLSRKDGYQRIWYSKEYASGKLRRKWSQFSAVNQVRNTGRIFCTVTNFLVIINIFLRMPSSSHG